MNWWLILLPLSGAIIGFVSAKILSGYFLKSIVPAAIPGLKDRIANSLGAELNDTRKLTGATDTARLLPLIESHIDDFLRNRLKIAIPMIGMMIGERTISQLKEVFMTELESILPGVLADYLRGFDISAMTSSKIDTITPERYLRPLLDRFLIPACVGIGVVVGLVNWIIVNTF